MTKTPTPLVFTYTNWRGETSERRVIPETFRFAATDWHLEPQWLLVAWDIDKGARRDFAWKDIRFAAAGHLYLPVSSEGVGSPAKAWGSIALNDVVAERLRQIVDEGWSPSHDDSHVLGELSLAAALYAIPYETKIGGEPMISQDSFIGLDMAMEIVCGWNLKPEPDRRKRLVKAGAMILAEIERLDRLAALSATPQPVAVPDDGAGRD